MSSNFFYPKHVQPCSFSVKKEKQIFSLLSPKKNVKSCNFCFVKMLLWWISKKISHSVLQSPHPPKTRTIVLFSKKCNFFLLFSPKKMSRVIYFIFFHSLFIFIHYSFILHFLSLFLLSIDTRHGKIKRESSDTKENKRYRETNHYNKA